ncbi:MAG: 6-bladed beta-propeller [Bacteroidales bacterium]|jgi:hypothetical protein
MNYSSIKTFALVAILLLNACTSSDISNKNYSTINIADNIGKGYLLNISEIADSVEYIPLETTDSSLLGTLRDVYYSNGFFVLTQIRNASGTYKIFDRKGQFYNTLNRQGRGPQEYTSVYSMDVYNNNIILLTINKLNEYSFDGEFIRTISLVKEEAPFGYSEVKKLDDNHYLLTPSLSSTRQYKYSAFIVDSTAKIILSFHYPESEIELAKNQDGIAKGLASVMIFKHKGIGKVISGFNEFIISHDTEFENVDTIYKINYGKYQHTAQNIGTSNKNSKLINLSYDIMESNDFMFMSLGLMALAHKPMKMKNRVTGNDFMFPISCALYDKRDGNFRLIDQPADYQKGFIEDFEGGPAFWPNYISEDEYMVSFISASEFIEHAQTHKVSAKFKKIADGLKETDNPVLVLVKLRK